MKTTYAFSDILLVPADFSTIKSRKDVAIYETLAGESFSIPIIASNMDSVYSPTLSKQAIENGAGACVHRFCTIEENVKLFKDGFSGPFRPWVSIGVSDTEKERAEALFDACATVFVIDVANGATQQVVDQFVWLREKYKGNIKIVVGNFATARQIRTFVNKANKAPDLFKCNIGSGAACTTRIMTGVGLPSVSSIQECVSTGYPILHDGGITNSGDFCKALALGAKGVMVGKLFAQCWESGAKFVSHVNNFTGVTTVTEKKIYRGSASWSSYEAQGKLAEHRAVEGDEFEVDITGTVKELLQKFDGGLRSSMTYLNAKNLEEYRQNAEFVLVSNSGMLESNSHGRK